MKVKVLSRNPDRYFRETKNDIHKVPRNYDPALHPFEMQREYTRALNAVKLERVFAKPFIGALDGHGDVITCLGKHPSQLSSLFSADAEGVVKQWNVPWRKCVRTLKAHQGSTKGIAFTPDGETMISVGDDKNIQFWDITTNINGESTSTQSEEAPKHTIPTKYNLSGVSHHVRKSSFATSGDACLLWDPTRTAPIQEFQWGVDSVNCVRFNQSQSNVVGACAVDRSVLLYDIRGNTPIRKVVLKMRSNALSWNPMEPFVFAVGNEDYNSYLFDMRRLKFPMNILKDHVSAVTDIDFSPTGKELVSGSWDKTLRIFEVEKGHSREVYHTKRMQRLTCVLWTLDNKFVISGSDEMNVRIWKAKAWEKLGVLKTREREALSYNEALKEKFAEFPQVKRIARHRHVPKHVFRSKQEHRTIKDSTARREANRRAHSRPGTLPFVPERTKSVVKEVE